MLRFEIGRRLIVMWEREREVVRTFGHFVSLYFPDVPKQRAYEDMKFAVKASKSPLFKQFAEGKGNFAKALALMESVEDEELEQFESTGEILGLTVDALDRLSVRELKARIKKLEADKKEAVIAAVDKVLQDNTKLMEENEALKAALAEPEVQAAFKIIRAAEAKVLEGAQLLRKIPQEIMAKDATVRNVALASCDMMNRIVEQLEQACLGALNKAAEAEGHD